MSEPKGASTTVERLARLEAMMTDTRDDVKTIINEMREWKRMVDERATNLRVSEIEKQVDVKAADERVSEVEKRLTSVEKKVWLATGAASVLSFLAGMFGKDLLGGK